MSRLAVAWGEVGVLGEGWGGSMTVTVGVHTSPFVGGEGLSIGHMDALLKCDYPFSLHIKWTCVVYYVVVS